ncbi:MAG: acyl-CoA synthetase [SAR202 cluster bacterium Ae2-Chloro-G2]|nr:MAG: acyl-CoA synthetase [SAR202 cluster bacterium Ae2-Chloro-G2]
MLDSVSFKNLNPISFLDRSSFVYPDKPAVIYGDLTYTYAEMATRVNALAGALLSEGIEKGDRVAFLVPNTPAMLEGHYGPLKIGAVLVAINIRLSAREVSFILNHSGAKVLVFDSEFADLVKSIKGQTQEVLRYVQVVDTAPKSDDIDGPEYEEFLASSPVGEHRRSLDSETDAIAINYTSGTTGLPKGVQYHARGAYLNALGEVMECGMNWRGIYLWTLPMFHCNGWCFTWGVTALGATHVCLRKVNPKEIYEIIKLRQVTHMCCAPTILTSMYSAEESTGQDLSGLTIVTAGAPPAPQVIRSMEDMGAYVHHAYGLTETYGPHTICAPQLSWDNLTAEDQAKLKSRQGVPFVIADTGLRVVDSEMNDVARDGKEMGEVVMRGNNVMSGYFNDPAASSKAFDGGWFHSGDLAVWHPDGYIELQDRAKDVIISGGENISSQEVEKIIMEHSGVLEVCVVGVPDDQWGEVPKAFIVRRAGSNVTETDIIDFTRERIAHYKAPKHVEFGELPKTATGKIQKYVLRDLEWKGKEKRIQGSTL